MRTEASDVDDSPRLSDEDHVRRRMQVSILLTMYLGYAGFMLCRNTLVASSAEMIQDPSIDLDAESYGQLMSWHSAGAIAGKLVTGVGADLMGGRRMFLFALSLTAVANLGFAFCSSFVFMAVLNFLGQFFKAGGWPAMTKIVAAWYPPRKFGQVWSIISTSSRVGTITALFGLGMLLTVMPWRWVFVVSAIVTFAIVAVAFFLLKESPESVGLEPQTQTPDDDEPSASHPLDDLSLGRACLAFAASRRFWLIGFSIVFLTILMDFINFIPVYLSETLEIDGSRSAMATTAFPAGMFAALIATSLFYDRLSKRQLTWTLSGLLLLSCLCVVVLWNLASLPISTGNRLNVAMGIVFMIGFAISPAYYVPMSIFAIVLGGRHSGFLVSAIDVFGYSGALLFNFFGGSIAQQYGWSVFLTGLLIINLLALVCMTGFLTLDSRSRVEAG